VKVVEELLVAGVNHSAKDWVIEKLASDKITYLHFCSISNREA
jgi:hypothetical protein